MGGLADIVLYVRGLDVPAGLRMLQAAELYKYTVITEPVAVPYGIAAVVRMAVECREGDGCSDDGDAELCEAVDKLSPAELAACGAKGGEHG
jgi:hypothetical protein